MSKELPKIPKSKKESLDKRVDLVSEEEYISEAVEYALSTGWVKEEKKGVLIERYLRPIYKEYVEVIDYLRKNNVDDTTINGVVRKLNWCLHATRRIGSTDASHILRTVEDYVKMSKTSEEDYALSAMYEFLVKLLSGL